MTGRIPPRTLWVGYGRLGARAGEELLSRRGEVIALRRSTAHAHDGIRGVRADLSEAPAEALPVSQAMVITLPPPQQGYRGVLENLAAALPRVPERTVFVSSTRVFDGDAAAADPAPLLTEQDRPSPRSERARALREGERIAEDLFGALVVRPAGIYGPGRDRLLRTVLSDLAHPDFRSGYAQMLQQEH